MGTVPIWQELASAGLARAARDEQLKLESIKSSINIRFATSAHMPSRPVEHMPRRALFVTILALGRDRNLRIYFERTEPVTIWAASLAKARPTE